MSRVIASFVLLLCLAGELAADSRPLPPRTDSAATTKNASAGAARKTSSAGSGWWTTMGSLVAVIALIVLVAKLVRRHSPAATRALPAEAFRVLGRRSLDFRNAVHLVRLGSRLLVLGVSPEGMRTLAEITDPVEVDYLAGLCTRSEPAATGAGFSRMLERFGGGDEPAVEADPAALRLKTRLQQGENAAVPDDGLPSIKEAG